MSENASAPVGAALVIGGGIAGVQAAIDLANAGIKVYLAERSPAIGGKMAQLDKTFPTNDCAICIISPKLAECGRHPNITILTNAEVTGLRGEAGNFVATVRQKPRYVDLERCTSCDDCAKVCPVHLPDEYNERMRERTAIYRPYAQAIPSAYAITKRGTSPCKHACPADTSAQGYVALIAQRRYAEAFEVVREYNPFPATVGRVCNHPCESQCNRGKADAPVAICALKRFVADYVYEHGLEGTAPSVYAVKPDPQAANLPVAVVGAGPAGLSAAYFLARMGHPVTVFEALPVAGGMMRVGIPAYRLPRDVLDREIQNILKAGVELRLNTPVRNLNNLLTQGFKAVFLAIGAHQPQKLGIPGEDVEGVFHGVPFLRAVALGESPAIGRRVVVVGGGNTAIDTARTALRLGAEQVTILYRRDRDAMPANPWEVEEAEHEGIRLQLLTAPVEVLSDDNHVVGVRCVRMQLGEPDSSGRPRPIPIPRSEFTIPCDTLVAAVAQAPEISLLDPDHGLEVTRFGTFQVDPKTLATNRPGIFAGGDAARGPGALIEAIAAGRRGALSIHRYLKGEPLLTPREEIPLPVAELSPEEVRAELATGAAAPRPRAIIPTLPVAERLQGFAEVELTLDEEAAVREAERCLGCGICSECHRCVVACKAEAIDHQQAPVEMEIPVGAVVLATGYNLYDARRSQEYGFGRYPNVVTAMQYERLLSASGPTAGHVQRPSDNREAKRIAWLQCVGSRDTEHDYCSSVCCMYATKQALLTLEHVHGAECHVFLMDMRAFSKGFDAYFARAQEQGIRYHRCRVSSVKEDPKTRDLLLTFTDGDGVLHEAAFDLVVLSVGMEIPPETRQLAESLGVGLRREGFARPRPFHPVETDRPGVFVCGAVADPKDIPDSVVEASAAAAAALEIIGKARGTQIVPKTLPPETPVQPTDEPRIGVFVCSCGSNIAGVVDVAEATRYAASLPGVVHAENTLYTCSPDSLKIIKERIREHNLNRVIVASCTPRTHEPLFRETIREAGLNPYLFEMANIRDQCSWVHSSEPTRATRKSEDLIRMAVWRARTLEPLYKQEQTLFHSALVVGGGVAGMSAALSLAEQGFPVYLVERSDHLGGMARDWARGVSGSRPAAEVAELVARVASHPKIEVLLGTRIVKTQGFVGNFRTTVASVHEPTQRLLEHGVTIIATGGQEYRGTVFGLGSRPEVVTQGDLERTLAELEAGLHPDHPLRRPGAVVAVMQCVGPWDEDPSQSFYCSRICCAVAMKNALRIKALNPQATVVVFHEDVRTYAFHEALYTQARDAGVLFVRLEDRRRLEIAPADTGVRIQVPDAGLGQDVAVQADMLVLSSAIIPAEGSVALAETFKFSCTLEGFFAEAHVKLRPVDFPAEGLFLCGAAHYPKTIEESIAQARAAAARAAAILSKDLLEVGGVVAVVTAERCTACLTCVRICPFGAPRINPDLIGAGGIQGAAEVKAAACQGCGLCVAECPAKAIQLMHYKDEQLLAKVEALLMAEGGAR
ncbi:MAG: FAD-dependent oxidoreductase [Anaerolineales bacterium]